MTIRALFTTTSYPASRLIRGLTGEPVSHCALQLGEEVVEASFTGVRARSLSDFLSHNKLVLSVDLPGETIVRVNGQVLVTLLRTLGKGYDFGALLFLGAALLLRRPVSRNLWASSRLFTCTEFLSLLLFGMADDIITPLELYHKVKKG